MSFGTSSPASLAKNCAQRKEIMELCSTQARTHARTRNDRPARICSPRLAAPQLSLTLNSGVRGGGSVNTMIIKACHLDTPGAERMAQLFPAAVLFQAAVSVRACMSARTLLPDLGSCVNLNLIIRNFLRPGWLHFLVTKASSAEALSG